MHQNKSIVVSLLVILAAYMSACGSKSNNGSTSDATLEGNWSFACLEITNAGNTELQSKSFDFAETTFAEKLSVFAEDDTNCATVQESRSVSGTYTNDTSTSPEEITFKLTSVAMTVNDDNIISYLNAVAGSGNARPICGGGWSKGKAKQLKKADCQDNALNFPFAGQTLYDIYDISGNNLTFGLRENGNPETPAQRPTQLNSNLVFERQN